MKLSQAWLAGARALARYPWLALIPAGINLLLTALAWNGVPLGPILDVNLVSDHRYWYEPLFDPENQGRFIPVPLPIPSWLPSVEDLNVAPQPEALMYPGSVPMPLLLAAGLLVPLLKAAGEAFFLVLTANAVALGEPRLRQSLTRILRAVPGLFILHVIPLVLPMIGPRRSAEICLLLWCILFPLTPLIIAAGDRPLLKALWEAPGQLWGRWKAWLGWAVMTAAVSFVGGRCIASIFLMPLPYSLGEAWIPNHSVQIALFIYAFAGTWATASAAALYLHRSELLSEEGARRSSWLAWAGALAGTALLAWEAGGMASEWQGWRMNPVIALYHHQIYGAGLDVPPEIVKVYQYGGELLVHYRERTTESGFATLQQNRFGWKALDQRQMAPDVRITEDGPSKPADLHWFRPSGWSEGYVVEGEILEEEFVAIDLAGEIYPLSPADPYVIIPLDAPPAKDERGFTRPVFPLLHKDGYWFRPDEKRWAP